MLTLLAAAPSLRRLRRTTNAGDADAHKIEQRSSGAMKISMVVASGVGVMIAATMAMIRMA